MKDMTKPCHPQRLALRTPPGSLLKQLLALAPRHRSDADRDEAHLVAVRQCVCLRCGLDPAGEAAHVRLTSGVRHKFGGMGRRPADKWTLPLCSGCHWRDSDSQHRIGEIAFYHLLGLDPLLVCERLYAKRGDLVAMRAVIFNAIEERG